MMLLPKATKLKIGRVDRASAAETVNSALIPSCIKSRKKFKFAASLFDIQPQKAQREASTVCGRQMGWWQLDLKIKMSLGCLLAKATW